MRSRLARWRRWAIAGILVAAAATTLWVVVTVVGASLPPIDDLARGRPGRSALMKRRAEEARRAGRKPREVQIWVGYNRISPWLRRAVLIAEDDAFYAHGGLDWNEIRASARTNLERRRTVRGGSTITQQLARTLYLGQERTVTRKLKEVLLAMRMERALTKRRIFELYLNSIEWGDGIYGVEAAARHHFGVSAAELDPRQSARLAAIIINPRRFSPVSPTRRIERRAGMILSRMTRRGLLTDSAYRVAIGAPSPSPAPAFPWLPLPLPASEPTPALETPEPAPVDSVVAEPAAPSPDPTPP